MRSKRTYSLGSVPGDVARVWEQPKQYVPPIRITIPELSAGLSETPLRVFKIEHFRVFLSSGDGFRIFLWYFRDLETNF